MSILLIGGTDPSGAGLQTDWQVVHHLNIQASSVVTAVTSQNEKGVFDQGILPYQQVKAQFDSLNGIVFFAIKIGMLGNQHVIKAVVEFLKKQPNKTLVILDPVIKSSSGGELLTAKGIKALLSELLPLVDLITPNRHELAHLTRNFSKIVDHNGVQALACAGNKLAPPKKKSQLTQSNWQNHQAIEISAKKLLELGVNAVLVKGGHFTAMDQQYSTDLFISAKEHFYLQGKRWQERANVRGTGCALATAIACLLSKKQALNDAVVVSKALISGAIRHAVKSAGQYQLQFTPTKNQTLFELQDLPKVYKQADELKNQYTFKRCDSHSLGIYPVVDSLAWIEKLLPLGIKTIQLRIKNKQEHEVEGDIKTAIQLAKAQKVRLFINDYWELAVKHKAYGIHLGQEDLDRLRPDDLYRIAKSGCHLGISTHSYTEVARAHAINPSYLALGPIFATTSKEMPWIPQGVKAVENWVKFFENKYPLVAIGGIDLERAKALKQTGVGSVAMISAITQTEDYKKATQMFLGIFE